MTSLPSLNVFFFFSDTATTEIYTLSRHDALPISREPMRPEKARVLRPATAPCRSVPTETSRVQRRPRRERSGRRQARSEEHTSELQSRQYLVCRRLLVQIGRPHA